MRRALGWSVAVVVLLAFVGLGASGWYYSDELLTAPVAAVPEPDVEVTDVDRSQGTITVAATDEDLVDLATVGLSTTDGELLLEDRISRGDGTITREASLLDGSWPRPGDRASASIHTYGDDPATGLGLPYDTIRVPSELGMLPAWRVVPNGASLDTWVVIVHGRGAGLTEGSRLLPTLADLELPSLTISLRNDPGAPADPDGFGYLGAREWEDLEAAVDHLRAAEGARRIVLVGYSQGGSTVLSSLRRSERADVVEAGVLISPMVSLHETLVLQARSRDIPDLAIPSLLAATRQISGWRAGLDFGDLEHVEFVDELPADVEFLVTHGTADATVPVDPTRELVEALPGQVVYEEYADVGHVREWNADPERFESDLTVFLETEVGAPA